MRTSAYADRVEPSATMAAGARAKEIAATGQTVYNFSLGEPDFNTPAHVNAAAYRATVEGRTHYTPAGGLPVLKAAVCDHHARLHGVTYRPENVCVSSGAKHTLYSLFCATLDPGDQVLTPTPLWVSYTAQIRMVGAEPVPVPTTAEHGFRVTAEALEAACTDRTRMLLVNSPSNPTGAVLTPADLRDVADLARRRDLTVVSDEIYDRFLFGDVPFQCFAALSDDAFARTFTVNGVSKTYAMTGWRIGWTCGDPAVVKAMAKIQSQHTGNPCSVSQMAAVAALQGDQSSVDAMHAAFARRRRFVVERLGRIPGVRLTPGDGAFYAFFDVGDYFGKTLGGSRIDTSADFCMAAIEGPHVVMVPGSAFEAEGYVRLSYATDDRILADGLDALEAWLRTAS